MKCWLLAPKENWIVDEMVKQFHHDNSSICTKNISEADVIWVLADWCFDHIDKRNLIGKPVVMMLHHFVDEKFDVHAEANFRKNDVAITAYTVPNFRTRDFLLSRKLTNKPIHVVPYWVHSQTWKKTGSKIDFRRKYHIPEEAYVVGSFVRDTEGAGISQGIYLPKLEKGPDIFCDYLESLFLEKKNLHVALAGWRRQYVIQRLEAVKIPYSYFELPSQKIVNDLYQTLDLYPVASRYEGGPQALLEAGMLEIPVVSRPVGMAEMVLPQLAINSNISEATPFIPNVEHLKTPKGYDRFIEILESVTK